ncbi:hypothetical protein TrCOL_g9601 [Triparma columacea]|uniref:CWF21 domain-containing protein n=1 Tax=Triparma columacea TaxID=722753 RepID=A0A9W7L242_9STRA|nr:hypothetical protein TrCOL_g9601 [Triparma columacea]
MDRSKRSKHYNDLLPTHSEIMTETIENEDKEECMRRHRFKDPEKANTVSNVLAHAIGSIVIDGKSYSVVSGFAKTSHEKSSQSFTLHKSVLVARASPVIPLIEVVKAKCITAHEGDKSPNKLLLSKAVTCELSKVLCLAKGMGRTGKHKDAVTGKSLSTCRYQMTINPKSGETTLSIDTFPMPKCNDKVFIDELPGNLEVWHDHWRETVPEDCLSLVFNVEYALAPYFISSLLEAVGEYAQKAGEENISLDSPQIFKDLADEVVLLNVMRLDRQIKEDRIRKVAEDNTKVSAEEEALVLHEDSPENLTSTGVPKSFNLDAEDQIALLRVAYKKYSSEALKDSIYECPEAVIFLVHLVMRKGAWFSFLFHHELRPRYEKKAWELVLKRPSSEKFPNEDGDKAPARHLKGVCRYIISSCLTHDQRAHRYRLQLVQESKMEGKDLHDAVAEYRQELHNACTIDGKVEKHRQELLADLPQDWSQEDLDTVEVKVAEYRQELRDAYTIDGKVEKHRQELLADLHQERSQEDLDAVEVKLAAYKQGLHDARTIDWKVEKHRQELLAYLPQVRSQEDLDAVEVKVAAYKKGLHDARTIDWKVEKHRQELLADLHQERSQEDLDAVEVKVAAYESTLRENMSAAKIGRKVEAKEKEIEDLAKVLRNLENEMVRDSLEADLKEMGKDLESLKEEQRVQSKTFRASALARVASEGDCFMMKKIEEKKYDKDFQNEVEAAKEDWHANMTEEEKEEWRKNHSGPARSAAGQAMKLTVPRGEGQIAQGKRRSTKGDRIGQAIGQAKGKAKGKAINKGTPPAQKERNKPRLCPCSELGCNAKFIVRKPTFALHLRKLSPDSAQEHYNFLSKKDNKQLPDGITIKWFREGGSKQVFDMKQFIESSKCKPRVKKKK